MTAYNSPPGVTVDEPPLSVGSPDVLVVHPDTPTVYAFVYPAGVTVDEDETETDTPPVDFGLLWPRGGPNGVTSPWPTRTSIMFSTDVLPPFGLTGEAGQVQLADSYRIMSIATNRPARVRLYTTPTARDADIARPAGTPPSGDHGLVLEFGTYPGGLSFDLSPVVDGFDGKPTPDGMVAWYVTNSDIVGGNVTVSLEWLSTEG